MTNRSRSDRAWRGVRVARVAGALVGLALAFGVRGARADGAAPTPEAGKKWDASLRAGLHFGGKMQPSDGVSAIYVGSAPIGALEVNAMVFERYSLGGYLMYASLPIDDIGNGSGGKAPCHSCSGSMWSLGVVGKVRFGTLDRFEVRPAVYVGRNALSFSFAGTERSGSGINVGAGIEAARAFGQLVGLVQLGFFSQVSGTFAFGDGKDRDFAFPPKAFLVAGIEKQF